jgi:hypothetical protein
MEMERPVTDLRRQGPRTGRAGSGHLRRAAAVAAGVGTALVMLNQGDLLLSWIGGDAGLPRALAWKIPLTYAVPFLVSWTSGVAGSRQA